MPFYKLLCKADGFLGDDQAAATFVELKQYLKLCASRPSRYISVINDNHLVSLMNFNAAKVD
jgi:hypothetical protein